VLAIGPLTNLALALQTAPEIAGLVKGVIAMGGSFHSQSPEFNIHCDPCAARLVLGAGWSVTLLGMEITRRMFFTRAEFASLPAEHPALRLFGEQAAGWIERVESMGWEQGGCSLHDAAAAAYLLHPEFFSEQRAIVEISEGETLPAGTTTLRPAEAADQTTVRVVTEVDAQKCKALIYSSFTQEVT
jgi:inosine-uridine nucleoside N-ribohydrolase